MAQLGAIVTTLFFLGVGCSVLLWFLDGNDGLNSEWWS
jgi:hypothetical protein